MIWLLIPDYGCEGLGAPIAAFADEARANEALEIFKAANGLGCRLVAIELRK